MGDGVGGGERLIGALFFLLAAICWAFYTLYGNGVLKELDPFPVTAYAMLTGAVLLGLFAAPDLMSVSWSSLEPGFWINQFYLALCPSVLANWFYYRGVQSVGASRAAMFMYIVPVSGVLLAVTLLGERLAPVQVFGSLLMVLGIWLVNRRQEPSPVERQRNRSAEAGVEQS
ncbi:DMT family transporter [Kroppenstedtia eburnea]|nr:drug/metabolite exporter family transporter [Desmospora sp. 8437]